MESAPILSTPETRLFDATEPVAQPSQTKSDEELSIIYDIERTLNEIRQGRWKRIALQFPDEMLPDAPRVYQLLARGLETKQVGNGCDGPTSTTADLNGSMSQLTLEQNGEDDPVPKLFILADTSYGSCCVDEIAAEHVNADVVVHYGRACLSPTARLPVIYVFTCRPLELEPLIKTFQDTYPDRATKVIITADVTYSGHVQAVYDRLVQAGYSNLFAATVLRDPSSPIPNRTVPESVQTDPQSLNEWQLFHISDPPTALLLTLTSRVAGIHVYPTDLTSNNGSVKSLQQFTGALLRRRYATLTSLSTAGVFGILINTLSVKNYLHIVDHVRAKIAAAGKKSYMFVVGKLNAAKVANFSEIDGWVVIGCWESSLVDSKDFWKPIITPFELELALQPDDKRVWTGAWESDYQRILDATEDPKGAKVPAEPDATKNDAEGGSESSDSESMPPEFNLRTGQYVTNSRPMHSLAPGSSTGEGSKSSNALAKRAKGDLAKVGGTVSPGAEFLRTQRTWRGLGSDFQIEYEEEERKDSTIIVEGRKGIARGYTVGDSTERR